MISPYFALFNNLYQKPPFDDPAIMDRFRDAMTTLAKIMHINAPNSHAHGNDDMLLWFRNMGFLDDPAFTAAMEPYLDDIVLRARLWRVYTLCWAAKSCMTLPGDYVDLGTYDGRTLDVMRRYCGPRQANWYLYDAFDRHPAGASKMHHGPHLADEVRALFADDTHIRVVKGILPDALDVSPDRIAFMQLDLNSADAELSCLKILWPRVVQGGIVVLDDYGGSAYRASYDAEKAFFEARGHVVFECPTSQGIVVKR